MPTKTFTTICPCFPGFYESYLSFDGDREQDYIDRLAENWDIPHDILDEYFKHHELDFNNAEYEAAVATEFVEFVEMELFARLNDRDVKAAFVRISSPAYYNFETDKVVMNIKLDPEKVIAKCHEHYEDFSKYLDERLSPRSGFIPFYGTNPEWWLDADNWNELPVLGLILDFIVRIDLPDAEWDLSELTMEQVDLDEYITLPKGMDEFLYDNVENGLDELNREYARLMRQPYLYLEAMEKQGNPPEKYTLEIRRGKARVISELAEEMAERIAGYAS